MTIQQKKDFIKKLDQTHMRLVAISQEEADTNPMWKNDNPLSNANYDDLVNWGVSQLVDVYGLSQTEAEKEMSWHIMEIGLYK